VSYRYQRYRRQRLSGGQLAAAVAAVAVLGGAAGATTHHDAQAGAAAVSAAPGGSGGRVSWARALLRIEGLPRTPCEVASIVAWEDAENSPASWHNPLDTTVSEPGSQDEVQTQTPGVWVQGYTSRSQGLNATDATLHNGLYGPVLAALNEGGGQAVADAVAASPWGTEPFQAGC
jgi:hypothetical protein